MRQRLPVEFWVTISSEPQHYSLQPLAKCQQLFIIPSQILIETIIEVEKKWEGRAEERTKRTNEQIQGVVLMRWRCSGFATRRQHRICSHYLVSGLRITGE